MRKLLTYLRILPTMLPIPTRPAAPAAPETSDFISSGFLPSFFDKPVRTIIGIVLCLSNSGSSMRLVYLPFCRPGSFRSIIKALRGEGWEDGKDGEDGLSVSSMAMYC